MNELSYLEGVLTLAARCGVTDQLGWALGVDDKTITFLANVGQLFGDEWDAVPVTASDVRQLAQSLVDVSAVTDGDYTYGLALYACRVRGQRPSAHNFPSDSRLHPLFEAVAPADELFGDDEPVEEVVAAFEAGVPAITMPASPVRVVDAPAPVVAAVLTEPVWVLGAGDEWPAIAVGQSLSSEPCDPPGTAAREGA